MTHISRVLMVLFLCSAGFLSPRDACGAGGNACGTCNAPAPTCSQMTTTGTCVNDPAESCTLTLWNTCSAPAQTQCGQPGLQGTLLCGGSCTGLAGPSCQWVPYGHILGGDPIYGFPAIQNGDGTPYYADPVTKDLLGLAAKGNIVIGDYTSNDFKTKVVPKLTPGPTSLTQPYVVDPADASLGYNDLPGGCGDADSACFSGNYDANDGGTKSDGSSRKFYESSLSDSEFQALMDTNADGKIDGADTNLLSSRGLPTIDAVLFTNHAFAGYAPANTLTFNGPVVFRDDGLRFGTYLHMNHDIRLLDHNLANQIALPMSIGRPTLMKFETCPPSGCPD